MAVGKGEDFDQSGFHQAGLGKLTGSFVIFFGSQISVPEIRAIFGP
jgi:hypothetical protein